MTKLETCLRFAGVPLRAVMGFVATLFVCGMGLVDPECISETLGDVWRWVWTAKRSRP